MAVPFIDLKRFEDGFLDRWQERCEQITRNTQFVGGPAAAELEERLAALTGVEQVVGCANGTDALQLALRAVGVAAGDKVLIPDATFWATFEAVVNVGARVVTVDVDRHDLQMDFELFCQAAQDHRPKAAILVHLYGWGSSRLADYRRFCTEHGIALVEDGAQTIGTLFAGEPVYRGCQIATTSFYPAKVLGSCGDAGAVFCNDTDLAEKIRQLSNHGRTSHYGHGLVGWNSRMGGFDAAFLNLSLDYLDSRLEGRRRIAEQYRRRLIAMDAPAKGVTPVAPPREYQENGYLNVLRVDPDLRPKLQQALKDAQIGYGTVYPGAMSQQPGAAPFLEQAIGGKQAELLAASVLNLPLFAHMRDDELDEVLTVVEHALKAL